MEIMNKIIVNEFLIFKYILQLRDETSITDEMEERAITPFTSAMREALDEQFKKIKTSQTATHSANESKNGTFVCLCLDIYSIISCVGACVCVLGVEVVVVGCIWYV